MKYRKYDIEWHISIQGKYLSDFWDNRGKNKF